MACVACTEVTGVTVSWLTRLLYAFNLSDPAQHSVSSVPLHGPAVLGWQDGLLGAPGSVRTYASLAAYLEIWYS